VRAEVDVVVLTRNSSAIRVEVENAIAQQVGVRLKLYRVVGDARPDDSCRWESIARARNQAKRLGFAPFLMFVDDDVVLERNCIAGLWSELVRRPEFAALAADYLGESQPDTLSGHVAMGATLFRRAALERISFRWESGKCECQCCCEDLRSLGYQIEYLSTTRADHRKRRSDSTEQRHGASPIAPVPSTEGRILAAFDRSHCERFQRYFVASLRAAGNEEWVHVVARSLVTSQRRALAKLRNVEVVSLPAGAEIAAVARLRDFQDVLRRLDPNCPVAYWDAADVWFQGSLQPLWNEVRTNPDKLLVAREPQGHPDNRSVAEWTLSIADPSARHEVFDLLAPRPYLNSGFAAGTAATKLRYFEEAHRLRHSQLLAGSTDWGDQTVLNVYCHTDPNRWLEVPDAWNYTLCNRKPADYFVANGGRLASRSGAPIHVIHGNAGTYYHLFNRLRIRSGETVGPSRIPVGATWQTIKGVKCQI
jgi:hypothetical protein